MFRICQLAAIMIILTACKSSKSPEQANVQSPIDKNLQVVIKHALSNKVDVMKGVYTVFFIGKPPLEVKFGLTLSEREQIINKYYALALYEPTEVDAHWGTIYIEDACMILPKIYTYLTVERDGIAQQIQIDEACDEYSQDKSDRTERVKAFLQLVDEIIKTKPEVKNAPESDIFYI